MQNNEIRDIILRYIELEIKNDVLKNYVVYCIDGGNVAKRQDIEVYSDMLKLVGRSIKENRLTYVTVYGNNPPSVTVVQYEKGGAFESFYYDIINELLVLNIEMTSIQNMAAHKNTENKMNAIKLIGSLNKGIWWN